MPRAEQHQFLKDRDANREGVNIQTGKRAWSSTKLATKQVQGLYFLGQYQRFLATFLSEPHVLSRQIGFTFKL